LRTAGSAIALAASLRIGAFGHRRRADQLVVGGERADAQDAAGRFDAAEVGQAADVDQRRRLRQAQLQHRQEAVAAGDQLGGVVLGQEAERVVEALGADVGEIGGKHASLLAWVGAVQRWPWMADHTFSEV
jgi:hypothetical protein